ncbi:hypothetical protein RAA17_09335 [Komagataeibacter rhaeticus]|nr:hypothetical protein [Komagataeibacter rhaeticus]
MGALLASALLQAARQIERTCFMDRYRGHAIMLLGAAMGSSVPMVALDRERHVVGATFAARMQMGIAPAQDVNLCLLDDTTAPRPGAPCVKPRQWPSRPRWPVRAARWRWRPACWASAARPCTAGCVIWKALPPDTPIRLPAGGMVWRLF